MLRAAALLASLSFVIALPASASDVTGAKSVTIRVVLIRVTRSIKDVPPQTMNLGEFTKGDTIRTTSILRNAVPQFGKPKGARVGTSSGVTVALSSQKAVADAVARIPGGTVHIHGVGTIGPSTTAPVVGGTGLYAGATGVGEFSHLANGDTLSVVRLKIP